LGVVHRCRQLQLPVYGIDFGSDPIGDDRYAVAAYYNRRAEMWGKLRDWLLGGMIDDDPTAQSRSDGRGIRVRVRPIEGHAAGHQGGPAGLPGISADL
jgi:hypothetical protein